MELVVSYENKSATLNKKFSIPLTIKDYKFYVISSLFGILAFSVCAVIYWERKKIKSGIIREERWIRRHKVSLSIFSFFIIVCISIYYLSIKGIIPLPIKAFLTKISTWLVNTLSVYFSQSNPCLYHLIGSIAGVVILIFAFILIACITKHKKLLWFIQILILLAGLVAFLFSSKILTVEMLHSLWKGILNLVK